MTAQYDPAPLSPAQASEPVATRKWQRPTHRWYIYGGLYLAIVVALCMVGFGIVNIIVTAPLGFVGFLVCVYGVDGILSNLLPATFDRSISNAPMWWVMLDRAGWALVFGLIAFSYIVFVYWAAMTLKVQRDIIRRNQAQQLVKDQSPQRH